MTAARLPTPPEWRSGTSTFLCTLLITLVLTVALTRVAVRYAIDEGQLTVATTAAAAAAGFLLIAVGTTLGRLKIVRAHIRVGPTGTVLTPRSIRGWFIAAAALIVFASGLYLVYLVQLGANFEILPRYVEVIVVLGISVFALVILLRMVGSNIGRLTLSPHHITMIDDRGKPKTVPWERVTKILDTWPGQKATSQPICIMAPGFESLVIKCAAGYCDDAAALYWMLRYYLLTPASRVELATDDALNRLAHNGFEPM